MANTYTLISSNVLTGSAASVTFSSIPSTYTDLVLRASSRTDQTGTTGSSDRLTLNGATATYSNTFMAGTSTTAISSASSGNPYIVLNRSSDGADATANTFSNIELYVPNYNSTTNKPIANFNVTENNASTALSAFVVANAALFQTSSAITSITIATSTGNFVAGSSFYLYGISKN